MARIATSAVESRPSRPERSLGFLGTIGSAGSARPLSRALVYSLSIWPISQMGRIPMIHFFVSTSIFVKLATQRENASRSSPLSRRSAPSECDARTWGSSNGSFLYILPPGSWHGAQCAERIGRIDCSKTACGDGVGEGTGVAVGGGGVGVGAGAGRLAALAEQAARSHAAMPAAARREGPSAGTLRLLASASMPEVNRSG
jgi:hypothetical protein